MEKEIDMFRYKDSVFGINFISQIYTEDFRKLYFVM